ncbi:MAG: phosphotransferase [Pseudomonadota bacterium]
MPSLIAKARARHGLGRAVGRAEALSGLKLGRCIAARRQSRVWEATLAGRPVIVKQVLGAAAADLARAQAEELKYQYPRMCEGPYRVPEPLFWQPRDGLVVMAHAPGLRFDSALTRAPKARAALLAAAGGWLAHYTAPRRQSDAFGGGYWIKRRAAALESVADAGDRARIEGLVAIMRAERAEIAGRLVTRARSHGDFCPINLMVDGDDAHDGVILWGVDIHNSRWLAVAKDIARFLIYLSITQPTAATDGPMGLAAEDVDALTGAKGLIPPEEVEMVLPFFLASELAGRLQGERISTDAHPAARALADRMIAARLPA